MSKKSRKYFKKSVGILQDPDTFLINKKYFIYYTDFFCNTKEFYYLF